MKEYYHKWYSQYIGKEFEMLVFGEKGIPVILFPTFNGRFYEHKDNQIISAAEELLNNGIIKIYCPDSFNYQSWHNYDIHPADRIKSHIAYEKLIINDVLGFAKYETNYHKYIMAGFEFGAYHSLNFTLRHPDLISDLLCVDGFYNIKQFIFGYYDDNSYFNDPFEYLPNLIDDWFIEHLLKINIDIHVTDEKSVFKENKDLSNILVSKKIKHNFSCDKSETEKLLKWKNIFTEFLKKYSVT